MSPLDSVSSPAATSLARYPARAESRRADIQVLRALAVLYVVFYHAGVFPLPRGYLGVDVFFVISGFLITKMIVGDIDAGTFSFVRFYMRRAKRLLPAAYCTFAVTAALAPFLLGESEYLAFLKQLFGSLTFTANVFLWRQTGYFEGTADFKPLLHVWSLSLEEQYYLLLPAFLLFFRKNKLAATALLFTISLALYLALLGLKPDAAFFLLPTRAWELLIGSMCAIVCARSSDFRLPRPLLAAALGIVLLVPALPARVLPPGADALLVTIATAMLIMGRYAVLENGPIPRRLAVIGDWSYSIYLVHWPLFAFAANVYVGEAPLPVRAALVALTFVLAFLQYRYVEGPLRFSTLAPATLGRIGVLASVALLVPIAAFAIAQLNDPRPRSYVEVRRGNVGLDAECDHKQRYTPRPACTTSPAPEQAIWGDSFAMHIVPALQRGQGGDSFVQLTRSSCGPVLDIAIVGPAGSVLNRRWAASCIEFNRTAFEYLRDSPTIRTVILSSPFNYYLDESVAYLSGDKLVKADVELLLSRFAETIAALRAAGKKVVVIAPPPSTGFDIGLCLERLDSGKLIYGRTGCDFPEEVHRRHNAKVIALLEHVEKRAQVGVLWPAELLCREGTCRTMLNGKFIYRDGGHFSYEGAREFGQRFALSQRIMSAAK